MKVHRKYFTVFSVAIVAVLVDQFLKLFVRNNLKLGESVPVIENIFHLTYITNKGSAFGFFKDFNFILVIISFVVLIVIAHYLRGVKEKERIEQVLFGLLFGGVVGNLIDRLVLGSVVDFLDFRIWPIFNIADSAITVGVIGLVVLLWKK